ncbi:MAG: methyltransferase [Candidatus Hodarchaeales archaeon]|jgi:methylase of polypeptide subunit release factors
MVRDFSVRSNPDVYPPSEDTWFLTDVLSDFLSEYKVKKDHQGVICEVGVGTAYILIYLSLKYPHLRFFGTEISPMAVSLSKENIQEWIPNNEYYLCCTRFFDCFNPKKFYPDVVYFNPPYVRTSHDEYNQYSPPITRSWAGGPSGVLPITLFLDELQKFRFRHAFFLSSSLNDNSEIMKRSDLFIKEAARQKIEGEHLICYHVIVNGES